jgi:hypothetical protein
MDKKKAFPKGHVSKGAIQSRGGVITGVKSPSVSENELKKPRKK